jgi:L-alanine-DL-glutamate epimerase-like enolase superfamily enzyme
MGILQVEVYRVNLRYREPFRIASGVSTEANNVVLKLTTDYDVVGWGESSPSKRVTAETPETVMSFLDKIGPRLIGMCPLRIEQDVEMMDTMVERNPAAKAAVDMALHDVLGKTVGKPLFMLIGGYRTDVVTDITLGIKSASEMAIDASKAVREGFRALKVKLGTDPAEDVQRVRMVRETVGDEVQIRVDANQGWTVRKAIDVLNKIEKFKIQFAEQPVSADDVKGLAKVRMDSLVPIMADESVHSPADALRLIRAEAVDLLNIKLMKCGGILMGRKIAEVAEAAGLPCMIGCMSESEIGIAAAAHLAAGVKNIQYADLDSDLLLRDKLVRKGGAGIKGSARTFSKSCGLGVEEVDAALLGKPLRIYK